jgi:sugar phosphate isomerase/epimerase
MGTRLAAVHLNDNDGGRDLHIAPGNGRVDFAGVFRRLTDLGFSRTLCIETAPFDDGPQYSLDAWKRMVDNVRALAQAAG